MRWCAAQVLGCVLWQAAFLTIHPPYRAAALQLVRQSQDSLVVQQELLRRKLRNPAVA